MGQKFFAKVTELFFPTDSIGVAAYLEFDTQGSRGANPRLEVATASRYLGS